MIRDGRLTAGHARTLLGLADPEARAREIVEGSLNVREAEQRSKSKNPPRRGKNSEDPNIKDIESNISNVLGLKVQITHKGNKGGDIRISYKTLEQFDDLIRRLSRSA
jgi:ParB family chromosome partitioning protein